jgi:o-succinylbenzoate synthase
MIWGGAGAMNVSVGLIDTIEFMPYRLPLTRPWCSACGQLGERRGWRVQVRCGRLRGYGDCAPLPAAGTEEVGVAWDWLNGWRVRNLRRPLGAALDDLAEADTVIDAAWGSNPAPAARYAAECALADLAAQGAGVSLAHWLSAGDSRGGGGSPRGALDLVPVNAALGALGDITPAVLRDWGSAGYQVLKVKVGLGPPAEDLRRLAALAPHIPEGVALRLDANRAWNLGQASDVIARLAGLRVEALEEPLRDPSATDLRRLQAEAGFPLALDESLHSPGATWNLADLPVRRVVLKPAAIGGLRRTLAIAARARDAGLEVVLTSLIDSAAGLWPTVHLAAAVGGKIPHGLATGQWLARDLGEAPRPRAGFIQVPSAPGGGFRPGPP